MKSSVFVILRSGISGGTGTLSIRLGEVLKKNGYEVLYICQEMNDLNNVNSMEEKGVKVHIWELSDICSNLANQYGNKKSFCFLTYSLNEYLFVEKLKERLEINKNILYVVHHYGLIKGANQSTITRKFIKSFYSKLIKEIIDYNSVIFMDDTSIEETEKYYEISINNKEDIVFNLPITVQEFDTIKIDDKAKLTTFNLLTITRAEFPFKGYVLGLIDDFKKLCDIHNDITLTIITFGKDEGKIAEKIKELPSSVQSKISLISQTPYEKLKEYFNQTHLYLGMGTTLLDAVNNGIPALAVQQYTYNNYSSGFFHMQPNLLVGKPDANTTSNDFIESVKQMDKHEYQLLCKKEYDTLLNFYSSDSLVNYLQQYINYNKQKVVTKTELTMHEFIIKISNIAKKYRSK